jgi:superfamily I DNA/RNA helicase
LKLATTEATPDMPLPRIQPTIGTRKAMKASPQQEAFFTEVDEGYDNITVMARAGSGKSSTARECMWRLLGHDHGVSIKYTCFNKSIATEFAAQCPPSVDVGTMHSFGLAALRARYSGLSVNGNRTYDILNSLGYSDRPNYIRKGVQVLVSHAKNQGYQAGTPKLLRLLYDLVSRFDVAQPRNEDEVVSLTSEVLAVSQGCEKLTEVDFDDMLWLPVVLSLDLVMPSCDFLFIDEAQDLSPVQHSLAGLLNREGRTILIGDDRQAIYGWRGADSQSMATLSTDLDCMTLPLTVSWRCPTSHVELARRIVPDFEAAPHAKEGEIYRVQGDLDSPIADTRPGDMVLCRNNAPLIRSALQLVANRRRVTVRGRAIGDQLKGVAARLAANTIREFQLTVKIWQDKEVDRLANRDGQEQAIEDVRDRAGCLSAVADACSCPSEIGPVIDQLFDDRSTDGRVIFSTIHRAKGSEAERVLLINIPYSEKRDKLKPPQPWEIQQRNNLSYVALTRSTQSLTIAS